MKNVLIIHGTFGKPCENWFPWIENELSKKEIGCIIPQFPTPEYQNFNNWKMLLDYYFSIGIVSEETICIGHSAGAVFLAKYLQQSHNKIKKLITISGFNNFISGIEIFDQLNQDFFLEIDKKYFKDIDIDCFISHNDPYLPTQVLNEFIESIGGSKVVIENAGHFNKDAGYTKFEKLLNILIEE